MSDLTTNTLNQSMAVDNGHPWMPVRPVSNPLPALGTQNQLDSITNTLAKVNTSVMDAAAAAASAQSTADSAASDATDIKTAPKQVTLGEVTESPYKTPNGQTLSLVAVDFTPVTGDAYFESVNIYFVGYNGNANPQLMANAAVSPAQFLCQTTHETVQVVVVAVSAYGVEADFASAPSASLALDGVVSAPPAPSISQAQVSLAGNTGWQFSFNIIGGLEFDQIQSYRVYHSESNTTPEQGPQSPNYFRTIPQPNTNIGQEVVQEVTGDILFYWVSAVNTAGLESDLTPVPFAYIDPGSPPPSIAPVSTTKSYSPVLLLNGWAANAHAGNYESGGGLGAQVWGTNNDTTFPYTNPSYAFDGNQATAANCSMSHTHAYAGCIWTFSNFAALPTGTTVQSASISVVSEVAATAGPIHGHADIWYSLDNGSTWTSLYVSFSARGQKTDTITLPAGQDFTQVQVMAFLDSHDDIQHSVYQVTLSVVQSANAGPQQVTGVKAELVSGNVQITWSGEVPLARTDILSYQVYRALHGAGFINSHLQVTITPAPPQGTYSWSDPEAHDGTWDYWVIAENSAGYSPASEVANLASASSVLYATGDTIESLRPAQAGADVTSQNQSASTASIANHTQDDLVDGNNFRRVASGAFASGNDVFGHSAMSDEVRVAIQSGSGNVLNVNGTPASTVSLATTGQQRNLIPDSDFKFGNTYWTASNSHPALAWVAGAGATGGYGFVYTGTGNAASYDNRTSLPIPVTPGQTYSYSCDVDFSAMTTASGSPGIYIRNTTNTGSYTIASLPAGFKGRVTGTFTVPSGVTEILFLLTVQTSTVQSGATCTFSNPQLEVGSVVTAYKPNLTDDATGYIQHGAMSNEVRIAIESGNGYVLNLGGTAAGSITPIANLMPAESGATAGATLGSNIKDAYGTVLTQGRLSKNLMDSSWWSPGAALQWPENGNTGVTDTFVIDTFPDGTSRPVWLASASGTSGPAGGWTPGGAGNTFYVDHTKTYMFVCYIRKTTSPSATAYWGVSNSTVCNLNTTTANSNPYFANWTGMTVGKWYLYIGWVFPYGATGLNNNQAGVYDCETGKLVCGGTNWNWVSGAYQISTRAFQFYASAGAKQEFAMPGVYLCDGSEPSLQTLLSMAAVSVANPATSSAVLVPQGSLCSISEGADGSITSATCNDNTITIFWTAFSIYTPDGTTYNIPANTAGKAFTGLAANTPYYFAAWYNIATQLMNLVLIGTAPGSLQYQTQTVNGDGNVGISVNFKYSTTGSTSTSGGTITPPPTGTCFSPETRVEVFTPGGREVKRIVDVERGDLVRTLAGTLRPVWYVSSASYKGPMQVIPEVGLSTPTHQMWDGSTWVDARSILNYSQVVDYDGTMHNLHIDARNEEEHSYTLANGQIVHNIFTTT